MPYTRIGVFQVSTQSPFLDVSSWTVTEQCISENL